MKLGDIIEVLAAACVVSGAGLGTHELWVGLLVAGVCLGYFAQVTAGTPVRLPRFRRHRDQ